MPFRLTRALALMLSLMGGAILAPSEGQAQSLWWWQQKINWSFKVDQLAPDTLTTWLQQGRSDLVLFDVRETSEHAVSHLPGAIQVSPNMTPAQFSAQFGPYLKDKTAVFYCSIGWRSSEFADRMQSVLDGAGTAQSYNLQGGAFSWHNQRLSLVDQDGPTDYIHPYDASWGRLVQRQDRISYEKR